MYFKSLMGLACIYLILGSVLLFSDMRLLDVNAIVATRGIISIAVGFFFYTMLEVAILFRIRMKSPDYLISAIIGGKSLRMLLTFFAILVYGILGLPDFIAFTVNIFIFYIVTMVFDTVLNIMKNKKIPR